MRLKRTTVFSGEEVIDRKPARAVNEDQREQKQNQGGEFHVLPLLDEHALGQPDIKQRTQQDRNLRQRRQPGEKVPYAVADAVARLVRFREPAVPRADWRSSYEAGLRDFERRVTSRPLSS